MKYILNQCFKPSFAFRHDNEPVVHDGHAITPSELMEMTKQGMAISASNLPSLQIYKTSDSDFTVPMEFRRNADPADMYQHRQSTLKKVREASDRYLSSVQSVQPSNSD